MNKKFTIFLIFFTAINIFAVTNYVSKTGGHVSPFDSWANAATNIQDAVDVASAGDIVLVNDGTYYPASRISVTKNITVKSVNGAEITIVNGSNTNRCFFLNNSTIDGFTIMNGYTIEKGGGVYSYSKGIILNCIISGNSASNGGGIFFYSGGTVQNCDISENLAFGSYGGGNGGGVFLGWSGTVQNCTIIRNSANGGGGVYCSYGSLILDCTISGNSAGFGGGMYFNIGGTIQNCIISGNLADVGGRAYCFLDGTVLNCTIIENYASSGGGIDFNGGGIVHNSIISKNSADWGGGVWGGTVLNCTICGNSAYNGGGVGRSTVKNSIIYFNTASVYPNYSESYNYTFEFNCTLPLTHGNGNITNEPILLDIGHIASNSPCVGAGNTNYIFGTDIDGDSWQNPPAIGCDQPVTGTRTGNLSVSVFAKFKKLTIGYTNYFTGTIIGHASQNQWSFGNGGTWQNTLGGYYFWDTTGTYKVILTALNDTYPAGISATVIIEVVEKQIHYVDINNTNPIAPYISWETAATNIQTAINIAAFPGDIVLVNDGLYYPASQIYVTNYIIVKSVNGAKSTIVDGNNTSRCFYVNNGNTIDGFTITNGSAYSWSEETGGGVYCAGGIVENCIISRNSANYGGGVHCRTGGIIQNCTIIGNSAIGYIEKGGGVYCYRGEIQNCIIIENSAEEGGGLYCSGGMVQNCIVRDNSAYSGAGVFCINFVTVQNCTFRENSASDDGGGVYCVQSAIRDCIIIKNSAYYGGGGIRCIEGSTIQNCTVKGNSTGVNCTYGSTILNSIIWNNTKNSSFSSSSTNIYNCIENWTNLVNGIITNDPQFISDSDLRLQSTSPCIDAGTNMSWMWTATDLDGNPRITEGVVDMGCYEFIPEPCLFIIYNLIFIIYYRSKFKS